MTDFLRTFQHLLPRTLTWSLVADRSLRRLFAGIADGLLAPAKSIVVSVWTQLDPDTTTELEEWENQFGLWEIGSTTEQRRAAIDAAWSAQGGQSPRFLQDTLQAHGFEVYYHGWRAGDDSVRNPHDYTSVPLIGSAQCREWVADPDNEQFICGESLDVETPECDGFLVNEPGYIVNESLDYKSPYPIPDSEASWRNFIYWGGEIFGTNAVVEPTRLLELKRLLLKHCPGHLWIVLLQEPPEQVQVFDSTFDSTFL
jgi:hypothetical protein